MMERRLDEKMNNIMEKPGVVGAMCVDKRGLTLSDDSGMRPSTPLSRTGSPMPPPPSSSSSSDDGEMAGSPKRERRKGNAKAEEILESSVKSAGYNIVFQVLTRVFTFALNAFILRYISHDVLGVCNVRLALLYSSIMFLSREPFRRAILRKKDTDPWSQTVNLMWLSVPSTLGWSLFLGYLWSQGLSNPGQGMDSPVAIQYRSSVWLMVAALIVDAGMEVPYIMGQYFMITKLRIVGDTTLILIRSLFLLFAVIWVPSLAIWSYALGTLVSAFVVSVQYYGYFYYILEIKKEKNLLPFKGIKEFLPSLEDSTFRIPWDLASLSWSFFQQGILKQLLTEGERYLMTFFDILAFNEQGIYDLVSNLGSLAARFIFLPVEESSYFYFAQTLERKEAFARRDKKLALDTATILGNLVKMMLIISSIILVYGIPYSGTLLFLYGGEKLEGPGTRLLQANCAYIFVMALNGVTETFTFAAMTQKQLDKFNRRLVGFSIVFLMASYVFTSIFGSVGFFMANSVNMGLRVGQSVILIRNVFLLTEDVNPFLFWKLERKTTLTFLISFILIQIFSYFIYINRLVHVAFGLIVFGLNCITIYLCEKDVIMFFLRMFVKKTKDKTA